MASITLTQLHCIRKQDVTGQDEPVIFLAGERVWDGKMKKGATESVNKSRDFTNSISVQLKEQDNKKYKLLGSWNVDNDAQPDPIKLTASSSGYHYELYYTVSA